MTIGEKLRELRKSVGKTVAKVAEDSEILPARVSFYEMDKGIPTLPILQKLAKGLDCTIFDIIDDAFNVAVEWFKSNWQGVLLLLVNPFVGAFKLIYDNCEEFRNFIDNLVQNIGQFFSDLWTNVSSCGQVCWESILGTWSVVSGWFNSNIIQPVSNFFTNLWNNIKNWALNCWSSIVSIWNVVSSWFDSNIISPLKNLFSSLWSKIQSIFGSTSSWFGNVFTNAYNAVKSAFSGVTNFFQGYGKT